MASDTLSILGSFGCTLVVPVDRRNMPPLYQKRKLYFRSIQIYVQSVDNVRQINKAVAKVGDCDVW
jgi:hypothetical protein